MSRGRSVTSVTTDVVADQVRLLVVTDWDVGFPLTSWPCELPDVAPGVHVCPKAQEAFLAGGDDEFTEES